MPENISFSAGIKDELIKQSIKKPCCQRVFLYNTLKNNASIISEGGSLKLSMRLPSMAYVGKIGKLLKKLADISFSYIYKVRDNLSGGDYYHCIIDDEKKLSFILKELSLRTDLFSDAPPPENIISYLENDCCQSAFIKSIIVTCGYFQNPQKNYHFEIRIKEPLLANIVRKILIQKINCKIKTHILKNSDLILLYSKSFENFEKMLAYLNVTASYFELENIKIIKEIKNTTNRSVNFETANIQRTANIAADQIAKIKMLLKSSHAAKLTPALIEMARLRTSNPHLSLSELAKLTKPKISKSAINNRLMRLLDLYREYESEINAQQQ
ncbi:MAG TPA: DNA-binding protein WhiA [Candidatus Wallbacteria bacterium]|nr:DNA-binding protein WhiA [Candidatus Wallbacteria bacterium]